MQDWFAVRDLDIDRLLVEWRWLCKEPLALIARNAFGDLFLRDEAGHVHQLDVAIGKLTKVADSEAQFRELALSIERQEEWFAVADEKAAIARGLEPNGTQCIGFSVPLVFAESGSPDTAFVADLYEHVSFLGDLNHQIADLADGAKVRLRIGRRP
jgi:hypothetical protein